MVVGKGWTKACFRQKPVLGSLKSELLKETTTKPVRFTHTL